MNQRALHSGLPDWGISFPMDEQRAAGLPLFTLPPDGELVVSLQQHVGHAAEPLVHQGDRVLAGQPIGSIPEHTLGARIHAPTSGTVSAVGLTPLPGKGSARAITIMADGRDEQWSGYAAHERPLRLSTSALRRAVIEAGIVGLGGATFPAGVKLNKGSGVDTLILNGAECEPCMNCDDALIRSEVSLMLLGAQIMLRILEADRCLIAVKEGMQAATDAIDQGLAEFGDDRLQRVTVPPIYPVGGEAQLIQLLTAREIPTGGLPWDSGAICQNVATAAAVARFLTTGEPLIRRIVTVTGNGVRAPTNVVARLGTPLHKLIAAAGGYASNSVRMVMGGPMMGIALNSDELPTTKATNCLYVTMANAAATDTMEMPCIRCGDCSTACPANLMPQLMLQAGALDDLDRLSELGLQDCIECGCCDYVCPSKIQLTQRFVSSKQATWEQARESRRAELASQRFDARNARLAAADAARAAELSAQSTKVAPDQNTAAAALAELLQRANSGENKPRSGPADKKAP
jgi:electron transport complex protein RnfC